MSVDRLANAAVFAASMLRIEPHAGQVAYLVDPYPVRAMLGGRRSGTSTPLAIEIAFHAACSLRTLVAPQEAIGQNGHHPFFFGSEADGAATSGACSEIAGLAPRRASSDKLAGVRRSARCAGPDGPTPRKGKLISASPATASVVSAVR